MILASRREKEEREEADHLREVWSKVRSAIGRRPMRTLPRAESVNGITAASVIPERLGREQLLQHVLVAGLCFTGLHLRESFLP